MWYQCRPNREVEGALSCSPRQIRDMPFRRLIQPVVEIARCLKPAVLASVIDVKRKIESG